MKPLLFFPLLAGVLASLVAGINPAPAAVLPAGFIQEAVGSGWQGVAGVVTGPNADGTKQRVYGWEASGKVWIVEDGVRLPQPLVDISSEIGPELGLLGFALDPDFQANGYLYLLYTVDRNALLGSPGRAPSVGRVTRYTCRRDSGFTSVDVNLRKVLVGETKSTGIPIIERSHGVGALVFGEDGSLLVSTGDGAGGSETAIDIGGSPNALQAVADGIIPAELDVGAWRSQSLDSMSGKILRIDPETGDGIAGNPFYQSDHPRSSRSRVWAYGLRNPFRFAIKPGSGHPDRTLARPGTIVLGDAGWNTADSLFVGTAGGQNFGWPAFEGFDPTPGYRAATPPAFVNTANRILPVSSWTPTEARVRSGGVIHSMGAIGSAVAGSNFAGRSSIGGTFIDSPAWPAAWAGRYLHLDWELDSNGGGGWVRGFPNVDSGTIPSVEAFGSDWYHVSHLFFDKPSAALYAITWPSTVTKITPSPEGGATSPGLLGERFENNNFTAPGVTSIVADPNFIQPLLDPPDVSEPPLIPAYSIRYNGFITPRYTETYRLIADINDAAKIWINDQPVLEVGDPNDGIVDYWLRQSVPISLTAGVPAKIRIDYVNESANARFTLFWSSARQSQEPIPASAYAHAPGAGGDRVPPVLTVSGPAIVNNTSDRFGNMAVFTAEITPSEPIMGLEVSDLILQNCGEGLTTGPPALVFNAATGSYSIRLNATGPNFSVAVRAGAAADAAGNISAASNVYAGSLRYQAFITSVTPPAVTAGDFVVALQVRGTALRESDFRLENATFVSLREQANRDYSDYLVTFRPVMPGPVRVSLTTDRFYLSGGGSFAVDLRYEPTQGPTVALEPRYLAAGETALGAFAVEVVSSAPLTGLELTDFVITNGTALSLTLLPDAANALTIPVLSVQPTAPGSVRISLPAGAARGAFGLGNVAAASPVVNYAPPSASASGLLQEFFAGDDFEALLQTTASNAVIQFYGDGGLPGQGGILPITNHFSVRSRGSLIPRYSETYRFIVDSDDGVRLWVNDQKILDSWNATGVQWQQQAVDITLTAGETYNIRLDYRDLTGPALQYLFWRSDRQAMEPVPASQMRPSGAVPPVDTVAPHLSLAVLPELPSDVGDTTFTVTIAPSEPITGLSAADFVLTGCRFDPNRGADPISLGSDGKYTLYLAAFYTSGITIALPAGVCTDAAGNPNVASARVSSAVRPVLTLTAAGAAELAAEMANPPGDFTFRLASPFNIGSLTPASFTVTNGAVVSWALEYGSRTGVVGYIGRVRPAAAGVVTLSLAAGALKAPDGGGPGNIASNVISATNIPPEGGNAGVAVRYFSDPDLTTRVLDRVVPNINFDWLLGSPGVAVPVDQFSARFTGVIVPPVTGPMQVFVRADDGARLWLDEVAQFDHFSADGGEWSATFTATAGIPVRVRLEYREGWGGAGVGMAWSGPGLVRQTIPSSRWLVQAPAAAQYPLAITPEQDAAAAPSQVPAAALTTLESLPEIGRSLVLEGTGTELALSWICVDGAMAWLEVESSLDLVRWSTVPLTGLQAAPASPAGRTQFTLPVPAPANATYYRLRAIR